MPRADLYFVWWWTWAFVPLLVAKILGRPCVVCGTFDHILPDGTLQFYPKRPWIHRELIRLVLRHADANIVCSEDQKQYLALNFEVTGLQYSPHVLDTEVYKPSKGAKKPYFLSICWLHDNNPRRKCIAELIEAFAKLPECYSKYELLICGHKGSAYPTLKKQAADLGCKDRVKFLGAVTTEKKVDLLQHCEIYLQPSRAEGFGVAILEAMACGAPVITSPVGPVSGITAGAAVFTDGENPNEIGRKIQTLLADPKERASMSSLGRKRALDFAYSRRKEDFKNILEPIFAQEGR